MARHTDNNNNIWFDGVTLTDCQYVHCGEGTTGTITQCRYAEIGEDNSVDINNSNYIRMGNGNREITIKDSDFIIIGSDNYGVSVGAHSNTDRFTRTGANSVTVSVRNVGVDVTGAAAELNRTRYGAVDGFFTKVDNSTSVVVDNANGNRIEGSNTVEMVNTNNDYVYAENLELRGRDAFTNYTTLGNTIKVANAAGSAERRSDSVGTVLSVETNELVGQPSDSKTQTDRRYTIVNGQWAEIVTL